MKSFLNDDDGDADDATEGSQNASNSSAKSIDGGASKNTVQSSHPYRVIEKDGLSIHSMQSLGRVGRILSGSLDPSLLNKETSQQNAQQIESPTHNSNSLLNEKSEVLKHQQQIQKSEESISQSSNGSLVNSSSTSNKINTILQEPDVIASTKLSQSKTTDSVS